MVIKPYPVRHGCVEEGNKEAMDCVERSVFIAQDGHNPTAKTEAP